MASVNGIKLVSTLVFPDTTKMRFEIFQGTNTPTMWGVHIYLLKIVDIHKSRAPISMNRTGSSMTHEGNVWIFVKGVSCENVTTIAQAEAFVEEYYEKNRFMLLNHFNTL
ncbi:TPA: hypothetical protein L8R03_002402 [Klebsiella pneumoniae]|uniref:hypothetical protein n=1 Tax=Klebsiella/Raoultella group TaxID=2890311 RepID=UPI0009364147|nr:MULTISPECIES: hypothetical protein [Klebsiella/Raoultella group]HDU4442166.1 hypothetical protein [Klebsiella pneumoniae subsp. pneumoniae]HDX8789120.1 hypothetical protein [Klebsiella michiganensis]MCU8629417.1 hypothetical protein [Klebsiella pneumoniae]MCU8639768.1 hypothetical protein [Klebsiella pneumoniae]RNN90776.1 hypothetical protein BL127_00025295 [Raoultella planticola]